ncbi:uncharacterized protein LOC144353454, partial [Saccoglossus kowalevskii]
MSGGLMILHCFSECQQMLENFNALEDICKQNATDQNELKNEMISRFNDLNKVIVRLFSSSDIHKFKMKIKKNCCPAELSIRIKQLVSDDETLLFHAMDGWNTEQNRAVRDKLKEQLTLKFGEKYSEQEYQIAIRRNFENSRIKRRESECSSLKLKNMERRKQHTLRWQ